MSESEDLAKAIKSKRKRDQRLREKKNTKNLEVLAGALTTLVEFEEAEINRRARETQYPLVAGAHQVADLMHSKEVLTPETAMQGLALIEQLKTLLDVAANRFNMEAG